MNTLRTIARAIAVYLTATGIALASAEATPLVVPAAPVDNVVPAAADCYSIGMQAAAREGGEYAGATLETRGGSAVCVIVILIPAKDGKRPRRKEVVVPAG